MASSGQGGAALGLQIAGLGAGIASSATSTRQGGMDKRISQGQEDPAIAALRKRLAAQNAQTAMSVAASQQGVNPALAQRNAQQALAQQQVATNANLASQNASSTLQSRQATRGQQTQALNGTLAAVGGGLNAFGTSLGTDAAAQAAQGAASAPAEGAQGLSAPLNSNGAMDQGMMQQIGAQAAGLQPEGAGGLAVPPQPPLQGATGLAVPPQGTAVPNGTLPHPVTAPAQPAFPTQPAGQLQMQGGAAQVMGQGLGQVPPNRSTMPNQEMGPGPVAETPLNGAPQAPAAAPVAVNEQAMAPVMSPREAVAAELTNRPDDPIVQSNAYLADIFEERGQPEMADRIRRRLLQDLAL